MTFYFFAGGKNDDHGSVDLCYLLATSARLFHRNDLGPYHRESDLHTAAVSVYLLACHEQFHVQSYHLLLDER